MSTAKPRGVYLLLGFAMNLLLGTAYAWSVFARPLQSQFGATSFTVMLPFAVQLALFSVGMVFAGRLVDRHGPRKVAILGGLLVGSGYILSSFLDRVPWPIEYLTLTYGVIVGLGIGFAYNPPIPTAVRWFPDRKGLASGVVVMGFGLSPLVTAPLIEYLIPAYGVSSTFTILGALFLTVLVALGAFLRSPAADWRAPAEAKAAKRTWTPLADVDTKQMIRMPMFWACWLLYVLGTAGGFMVIGKAKPIAQEVGLVTDMVLATAAIQILAVFNSAGRPLFGRIADTHGPKSALLLMYGVLLGAMALLSLTASVVPLYLGIGITGMVFGGFLAVMPALTTYFFGAKNLGSNYGFMFTGYGSGAIVALFAIGWLRDLYGTYVPAFWIGIILSIVGLLLSLQVKPPRPTAARVEAERVTVRA